MIVCDGCRSETCSPHTMIVVQNKPKKTLKEVAYDLCPKCVTTVMNNLDNLKKKGFIFRLPQTPTNGVDSVMAEINAQAAAAANVNPGPNSVTANH